MKQIGIGIVGAGFLAQTRGRCYLRVYGGRHRLVAVADPDPERAREYAERFGVGNAVKDLEAILAMPEIDMVDLCVPNHLHQPMTEVAAAAGKHVVCTKPLTAYVGQDLPADASEEEVSSQSRDHMLKQAVEAAAAMVRAADRGSVMLMYGENWIHSPSIRKVARLIETSRGTILEMRGGECHSGSHSPFSKVWKYTGGGALIRLGAHPIGTMLYLKALEGMARDGRPIKPVAVTAEVGDLGRIGSLDGEPSQWIARGWKDVENWASLVLSFEDGARGVVWASDAQLGGMESRLDVMLSNCRLRCNLSPNDLVESFAPSTESFGDEYFQEKLETTAGWSTPMPDEDWTSGHWGMCQSFVDCVAEGRPPVTDGRLGLEVVRVIYSAYLSAREGRRIELHDSGTTGTTS